MLAYKMAVESQCDGRGQRRQSCPSLQPRRTFKGFRRTSKNSERLGGFRRDVGAAILTLLENNLEH